MNISSTHAQSGPVEANFWLFVGRLGGSATYSKMLNRTNCFFGSGRSRQFFRLLKKIFRSNKWIFRPLTLEPVRSRPSFGSSFYLASYCSFECALSRTEIWRWDLVPRMLIWAMTRSSSNLEKNRAFRRKSELWEENRSFGGGEIPDVHDLGVASLSEAQEDLFLAHTPTTVRC